MIQSNYAVVNEHNQAVTGDTKAEIIKTIYDVFITITGKAYFKPKGKTTYGEYDVSYRILTATDNNIADCYTHDEAYKDFIKTLFNKLPENGWQVFRKLD